MAIGVTVVFVSMLGFLPVRRSGPGEQDEARKSAPEFAGKWVYVTFKQAGKHTAAMLKDAGVKRLGGREFLVGEYPPTDDKELADWVGVVIWLPVESIDNLLVFDDLAKARRLAERWGKPGNDK